MDEFPGDLVGLMVGGQGHHHASAGREEGDLGWRQLGVPGSGVLRKRVMSARVASGDSRASPAATVTRPPGVRRRSRPCRGDLLALDRACATYSSKLEGREDQDPGGGQIRLTADGGGGGQAVGAVVCACR